MYVLKWRLGRSSPHSQYPNWFSLSPNRAAAFTQAYIAHALRLCDTLAPRSCLPASRRLDGPTAMLRASDLWE
eukprot:80002-Pleurochrysis_carterae.AAC.4